MPGPELAPAVVPEPFLSALLDEAGAAVLASVRLGGPGLLLTEPGAAFADAGLTVAGLALAGGLEQMADGGAHFASGASLDSGCRATKEDGGGQSALTSRPHAVKLPSITAMFD